MKSTMKPRRAGTIEIPQTCPPNDHHFTHVDFSPRDLSYQGGLGSSYGNPIQKQAPTYRIYCVKCGEVRPL